MKLTGDVFEIASRKVDWRTPMSEYLLISGARFVCLFSLWIGIVALVFIAALVVRW